MKQSTLNRCKAWVHWVFKERVNLEGEGDPLYEDRLLMAQDIEKLIAVAEDAQVMHDINEFLTSENAHIDDIRQFTNQIEDCCLMLEELEKDD